MSELTSISWDANVIAGYVPHVDVFLDLNGDGTEYDSLNFEYAKVDPNICDGSLVTNDKDYPTRDFNTFDNKGYITIASYAWLNSGPAGPCSEITSDTDDNDDTFIFGDTYDSLANWKTTYPGAKIVRMEVEIDNWVSASNSNIKNILVNDVAVEVSGLAAKSRLDFQIVTDFPKMLVPGTYNITTTVNRVA